MTGLVMAIDVGTASARAGVIDEHGTLLGRAACPIALNRPAENYAEHDSEDIWRAVCQAARDARKAAAAPSTAIRGISFDATCSLVIRDHAGDPLSVNEAASERWDTIAWQDHRALIDAEVCTATGHPVLRSFGGVMSPEMQIPKLMWLKRRFPHRWQQVGYLFDLADFLTWRASGSLQRSHCTLTCKWAYQADNASGWNTDFLAEVGLDDLLARGKLPNRTNPIGHDLGPLTLVASDDLDITTECRVGVGLIDAHAGVLGLLGGRIREGRLPIERHGALIVGTSSSVMALSTEPRPTEGAWGPFYSAAFPGLWLTDAGQSATGGLLDHLIRYHGAGAEPTPELHRHITARIEEMRDSEGAEFARGLHVLPDFHGNRSPLAKPNAVGVVSGLNLDSSFDNLCRLYWRTAVGITLGIRHILDALNTSGHPIDTLHVTGGHTKNPVLMELYRNAIGCVLIERDRDHGVLLGTAAAAATAAALYPDLNQAAAAMAANDDIRTTCPAKADLYARDYQIFLAMHRQRRELDALL